jgi:hypothetical protein
MENIMKYVVCPLDGDAEFPILWVVPDNVDIGGWMSGVGNVGVGQPYWAFASLPAEILTADSIGV